MAELFVTGGDGWLGRNFLEALRAETYEPSSLAARYKKINVLSLSDQVVEGNFEAQQSFGDIRDKNVRSEFLSGCEGGTLINIAGVIHPKFFSRELWQVNNLAISSLAKLAFQKGMKKAVFLSSNSVCGFNNDELPIFDECSPIDPYMKYGASKSALENNLAEISNEFPDCQVIVIRSPWFYGPFQPKRQTRFFQLIKNGSFPIFGDGTHRRSMVYTENLVHGLFQSLDYETTGFEIFWIADERPYSWNEIIATVQNIFRGDYGFDVKQARYLPKIIPDIARYIDGTVQNIGLYNQNIHVLSEMNLDIVCSIEKAKKVLGYRPRVEIKEGMKRSINWCIENGFFDDFISR